MAATAEGALASARDVGQRLVASIEKVVHGKHAEVSLVVAAFAASGHVLLEDVPGTAKTVLARALAASIEGASKILNADPIRRAHPRFVENLIALGADVEWA